MRTANGGIAASGPAAVTNQASVSQSSTQTMHLKKWTQDNSTHNWQQWIDDHSTNDSNNHESNNGNGNTTSGDAVNGNENSVHVPTPLYL